ncbi:TPA: head-tail connector protein [Yersinia enterocolitica]
MVAAPATIILGGFLDEKEGNRLSAYRDGMLALISHWYENRSSVSDYEQSEVPMSFYFLVGSYRFSP